MNIQGWFSLELTDLISMLSKGLFKSLFQHRSSKAAIHLKTIVVFLWKNWNIWITKKINLLKLYKFCKLYCSLYFLDCVICDVHCVCVLGGVGNSTRRVTSAWSPFGALPWPPSNAWAPRCCRPCWSRLVLEAPFISFLLLLLWNPGISEAPGSTFDSQN